MDILSYAQAHWTQWVFAGISAMLALAYRSISARLKKEQARNEAIADGVQSLLRESIIENYNKYSEAGCCPIYAKESLKRVYASYEKLGGNDVAHELYAKMLRMPEERDD